MALLHGINPGINSRGAVMKFVKIGGTLFAVILAILVVVAPLGPMPGLFIGGSPTEAPPAWRETDSIHEIQLRVPGILPRVVNLWVVEFKGELYVFGDRSSTWISMIGKGGPVEMRMEGSTYSLTAVPVEEDWQPIYQAYLDKYRPDYPDLVSSFPSVDEAYGMGAIFRLARAQ